MICLLHIINVQQTSMI